MSETAIADVCKEHVHRWRVTAFEASSQTVGYRCADCGAERFTRPNDEGEASRGQA